MLLQILLFTTIFALFCVLAKQAREQYPAVVALAVLIVILPLNRSFNELGMSATTVLMVIFFIFNKFRKFTWKPIFYIIASVYFLNFVGLLHTGDFSLSGKAIDSALPMILFPVLFSMVQLSKRNVLLLLRFFLWAVIVVCVYGLLSYAMAVYGEFSWKAALLDGKRYARFFMVEPLTWHPSALSITLLMALPVSFYLRYHTGKQITLIEMLLAVLLPILVTLMVGARVGVAIIPVLLGLSYLFYCKFKPVFKWGIVAGGAMVGLCLILFLLPADIRERYTDQIRIDQRTVAISAIQEKPIFGWGTLQQRPLIACEERAQNLGIETIHIQPHFHNVYLDMMVQFGIVGIVALLFLIFWTFKIAIHRKHFLLLSFMAMYTIAFYFDNVLQSQRFVVAFMFWFCFLLVNWKYLVERPTTKEHETTCAISRYWGGKNQYTQLMKNALTAIGVKSLPIWFGLQADFAWLHWFENKAGKKTAYRFLDKCEKKGIKIIWNVHNKIPHKTENQNSAKSFMKHLAEISNKIVIHSTPTTEVIEELCESNESILKKIVYVPHPNYIGVYGFQKTNYNLDNNRLKLCFFGAVKKYKNVELLISAVTELGFDDVELSIYGRCRPREYAKSLRLLAEKNSNIKMHFRFVRDNDVPEILAACHLLVLPYNLDSSLNSGATILAFSYGRTVLSPLTGTLEDIKDKSLFFAYSYNNPDEHKEELKKQIAAIRDKYKENYNELLKLGEKCKDYVAEHNSSEQVSKQLKAVFQ